MEVFEGRDQIFEEVVEELCNFFSSTPHTLLIWYLSTSQAQVRGLSKDVFSTGFQHPGIPWEMCATSKGEYFEWDEVERVVTFFDI